MELRKVTQEELKEVLRLHELLLESEEKEGERANLSYCDLTNANLSYCDLRYADLTNANLSYCDLRYADLRDANLYKTNLFKTNLTNTNLSNANLRGADLTKADLYKTNLFYAKVDNMIGLINIGNENRTVYYFYKEDRVICGCFDNTLKEFKNAVKEKYGEDYGSYAIAVEMFEKMKDKN